MFSLNKKNSFNNKNEWSNSFLLSSLKSKIAWAIFWVLGLTSTWYASTNNSDYSNDINSYRSEYVVKRWDTLSRISNLYWIDLEQIFIYNPWLRSRKNLIHPWEKIIINNNKSEEENNIEESSYNDLRFINYTVKRNDNLWNISRKFNVSVDDIINRNPLLSSRKNLIHPWEVLKIPYIISNIPNFDDSKNILEKLDNEPASNQPDYSIDLNNDNFSFSQKLSRIIQDNYKNNINPKYLIPNRCWPNIREVLKAFWFNDIPSSWMNWYVYSSVLDRLTEQWKVIKVPISHPDQAKPGAILVYNKWFWRPGSPRHNYWHVEQKLENWYFRWHVNETYWWSITWTNSQTWFTWYAYYVIWNNNFEINNSNWYFLNLNDIEKNSLNNENIKNIEAEQSDEKQNIYIELNEIDSIISKVKNTWLYYTYLLKYFETNNLKYLSFLRNKYNIKINKIASLKSSYLSDKIVFADNININLNKLKTVYKKYHKRKLNLEHKLSIQIAKWIYVLPDDFEEKKSLLNMELKKAA